MKLFISLLFLNCLITGSSAQNKTIAIRCGSLLDTRSGNILSNQVILVKDNKIESVQAAATFKNSADSTIDLSGYFVLPGLIDCHTHVLLQGDITSDDYAVQLLKESIPYRTLRASRSCGISLQNGFTTIRDLETEGAMYADVDLKKAINNGIIPGPRMFVSTRAINTVGHYPLSSREFNWEMTLPKGIQEINGADEARRAVREQIAGGADWIKIYADRGYYRMPDGSYHSSPNFTAAEIEAVADETKRSRRHFASHAVTPDGIIYSVNAGARSIEHGFGMNDECIRLMAEKKVYWCPTIYVCDYVAEGRAREGNPINRYFMESFPGVFKKALLGGVKIAYGTDIGGYDWNQPQAKDFEYMVKWGMTNLQAIQSATIIAAQLLEQENIGELRTGAFADIIAVKGDPIKDIKILQKIQWVMKNGVVYKSL